MAQNDQGVRNVHGQGRFIDGVATGETFVDFGRPQDNRYVRVRVFAAEDGAIEVRIDGEMCAHFNDAPQMRVVVNGSVLVDSAEDDLPQPLERMWMESRG